MSRQTLDTWLARYEAQGPEGRKAPTIARTPSISWYASCMRPVRLVAIRVHDRLHQGVDDES